MDEWQHRVDAVWDAAAETSDEETVARIDALVAARPTGDPSALFEAAGARDYAGREADAEPLYRASIAGGLADPQRARAVIQLASTLRNLGRAGESVELLRAELAAHPEHELADAARAFLALALHDLGKHDEAVAVGALAPHLPLYRRAVANYARDLTTR
ncbi:tetratricopeptide repeat protein [Leifsonia lichenia]